MLPVVPKEREPEVFPAPCYGQAVGADVVQPEPVQVFWFLPVKPKCTVDGTIFAMGLGKS